MAVRHTHFNLRYARARVPAFTELCMCVCVCGEGLFCIFTTFCHWTDGVHTTDTLGTVSVNPANHTHDVNPFFMGCHSVCAYSLPICTLSRSLSLYLFPPIHPLMMQPRDVSIMASCTNCMVSMMSTVSHPMLPSLCESRSLDPHPSALIMGH